MHEIGGQMNAAREPRAANAVSGPSQGPGEAGSHEHDGKFQEASAVLFLSKVGGKQVREQSGQQKPQQPVAAKIGVQENGLENACVGQYGFERLIADRLRHQHEPGRTRQ
jgi:hypothetical protein